MTGNLPARATTWLMMARDSLISSFGSFAHNSEDRKARDATSEIEVDHAID